MGNFAFEIVSDKNNAIRIERVQKIFAQQTQIISGGNMLFVNKENRAGGVHSYLFFREMKV